MNISFRLLAKSDFPFLLKWLQTPYVKKCWNTHINWTPDLIKEKYSQYVKGYKQLKQNDQVIEKPMHAYIIHADNIPIGYIQYYNKHDFSPEQGYRTEELPNNCAAIDWYIGESEFIGQGIGPKALDIFLKDYVFPNFKYVVIDSDAKNIRAIRAYEKTGFKHFKKINNDQIPQMIKCKTEQN